MTKTLKYTRQAACHIIAQAHPGFDRQAESDLASAGGFRPPLFVGQVQYGVTELVVLAMQQDRRADGWPVRLAGEFAARLHRAMTAHPEADRLALVTLENGNRFAVPADSIDLTSGYSSGAPVREALIVDVRNLRARIERMIDAAAQIVGEPNEA